MIKNYITIALRNLWRNKFFSLVNILGLSVGITCCLLIFMYTKDEIGYDHFHSQKNDIYHLTADMINPKGEVNKLSTSGMMPGPNFERQLPEIREYVRMQGTGFVIKHKNEIFEQDALYADESFFSIFTFPLIYGDPKTALKDMHSVVLSQETSEKYFGDKDPVGQTLNMNTGDKFEAFVVTGVMKHIPQNSTIKPEMVVPMKFSQSQYDDKTWNNFFLTTFFLIKPGTDIKGLENKFNKIYLSEAAIEIKEMAAQYGLKDKITYSLQPFLKLHLSTDYPATNGLSDASNPIYSYILTAIAVFVLLIACFNFINLTVARSLKRAKEIGVRKVIGSRRGQLIAQFLGESFVICSIAFVCALILLTAALPLFNTIASKSLAFSYLLDLRLIFAFIALFIITGLLAGSYPAFILSAFKPVETLYGRLRHSGKDYLSKGLIVLQFTLATFLIIATVIIYKQFNYLVDFDLGYDCNNILTIRTPSLNRDKLDLFENELEKNPSINSISATQAGQNITIAHINGDNEINFDIKRIDENYLGVYKITLLKGRNFSKEFPSDSSGSIIINEEFAKTAGWKDPLGKEVDFFYRKKKYKVIGVIKNYHFSPLGQTILPEILHMDASFNSFRQVMIRMNPSNRSSVLAFVSETFKKLYPEFPYKYAFKDEDNRNQYESELKWKQIITFSAILAIFISCIGLFALAALSAERRSKEIGIRKVFGASVSVIVKHLTVGFLKLVGIAILIATPLAWWLMNKWLQNYPYRIDVKPLAFVLTIVAVLFVAFLTICYQSVRAAIANPVKSLRSE